MEAPHFDVDTEPREGLRPWQGPIVTSLCGSDESESRPHGPHSIFGGSSRERLSKHLTTTHWRLWDFAHALITALVASAPAFVPPPSPVFTAYRITFAALLGFGVAVAGTMTGLYETTTLRFRSKTLIAVLLSCSAAMGVAILGAAVPFKLGLAAMPNPVIATILFLGLWLPRFVATFAMGRHPIRLFLIGSIEQLDTMFAELGRPESFLYSAVGFCPVAPTGRGLARIGDRALLETGAEVAERHAVFDALPVRRQDLVKAIDRLAVDRVVVADGLRHDPRIFQELVSSCVPAAIRLHSWSSFLEDAWDRVLPDALGPSWIYEANLKLNCPIRNGLKRCLDVLFALVTLGSLWPLMLLLALAIRLGSRGPIIFSQVRSGLFGRPFTMYKFRTMIADAEEGGARWASENDARCTPFGRLLRRTRLDELPQLWNILRGDMSLVGPRPERPEFLEVLCRRVPFFDMRNAVKPGLTGFAQVNFGYGANVDDAREKLSYDLYYVKHFSMNLDLQIILRTFSAMFRGAR